MGRTFAIKAMVSETLGSFRVVRNAAHARISAGHQLWRAVMPLSLAGGKDTVEYRVGGNPIFWGDQ